MKVDVLCPGCGRTLRVASDTAPQPARCPSCSTLFEVAKTADGGHVADTGQDAPSEWMVRIPEGLTYGPVSRDVLERWRAEHRITADCQVRQPGDSTWVAADRVFPDLRPAAHRWGVPTGAPPTVSPGAALAANAVPRRPFTAGPLEPHRGALVLALGILSWVSCPLFGLFAWITGNRDLNRMQSGRMDPAGRELTQAGRILGMVHLLLILAAFIVIVPLVVLFGLVLH